MSAYRLFPAKKLISEDLRFMRRKIVSEIHLMRTLSTARCTAAVTKFFFALGLAIVGCASVVRSEAISEERYPVIGAYIWNGMLGGGRDIVGFHQSVRFLLDQGFDGVRFAVALNSLDELGVSACPAPDKMSCVLSAVLGAPVFDDPRLRMIMITLHGLEGDQSEVTDVALQRSRTDAMRAELESGLSVIGRRFSGSHVRIVISNWEGDNLVFCGSAFRFAISTDFAKTCGGADRALVVARTDAVMHWLQLRNDVVRKLQKEFPFAKIVHFPEVNNVVLFDKSCRHDCAVPGPLYTKLDRIDNLEGCSYSSYDALDGKIREAVYRLSRICKRLILGEVGVRVRDISLNSTQRISDVVRQIRSVRNGSIDAVFIWNAFEATESKDPGFGLFFEDGRPRLFPAWRTLQQKGE